MMLCITWTGFVDTLARQHWGDLASVAGVVIALIGFGVTALNIRKTRHAADAASQAVNELRDSLGRVNTVADLSRAISITNDIKRLHRDPAWDMLQDRYTELRQLLVGIINVRPPLCEEHLQQLGEATDGICRLESTVEKAAAAGEGSIDPVKLNRSVASQTDKLCAILAQVQNSIGE